MRSATIFVKFAPGVRFYSIPRDCLHNDNADSSTASREVLCDEMLRYVGSLNNVNSIFTVHEVPTIEEYWERREATAAAHCVIATLPYGIHLNLLGGQ